jgi:pimeloyl-ACP methyl ester carboxylesterase
MAPKTKLPFIIKVLRFYFSTLGKITPTLSSKLLIKLFSTPQTKKVRQREKVVLKGALHKKLAIEGHDIQVYEWGQGNKIAYLLHGWEGNGGSMGAFVSSLSQMGYKVITFDGPAHGKSSGKTANLMLFSKVFKGIVDTYGPAEIIISHSFGTSVMLYSAVTFGIQPKAAALLSGNDKVEDIFHEFAQLMNLDQTQENRLFDTIKANYNLDARELIMSEYAKKSGIQKALLIHDVNDRIIPFSNTEALAKNWPAAKVLPVENTGHYKMLWAPAVINPTIAFFKELT